MASHQEEIERVPWALGPVAVVVVVEKGRRGQSGRLAKTEPLGLLVDQIWERERSHEASKLCSPAQQRGGSTVPRRTLETGEG